MALDFVQSMAAGLIVLFLLLGILYLWNPPISERVWLGILFILIGLMILLFLVGAPDVAAVFLGAIGAFIGRVVLDRMGVGQ